MAPEIHEQKLYKGEEVDLFAAGIILFIMVAGTPPFTQAKKDEMYYKFIYNNKWDIFWKYHIRGKPGGDQFFSPEFKDLIQRIFVYDPKQRLSMTELVQHPWVTGQVCSKEEAVAECGKRKEVTEKKKEEESKKRPYGGTHRGIAADQNEEEQSVELTKPIEEYISVPGRQTLFRTKADPEEVLLTVDKYFVETSEKGEEELKYEISPTEYKARLSNATTNVDLSVKVTKAEDGYVVEFTRKGGELLDFINTFKTIKEYCDDLIM